MRLVAAMVFIFLCVLRNVHAGDGSNPNHTVITDSLRWQTASIEVKLPYCVVVIRRTRASVFPPFFFPLAPFMFVSFKEDDASKDAWHIKKFHMPKADNQWKNNYLYVFLAQQQQR